MKDESEPAFPAMSQFIGQEYQPGMSLRDYFAARAMATIVHGIDVNFDGVINFEEIAKLSFVIADAMLAERNKE